MRKQFFYLSFLLLLNQNFMNARSALRNIDPTVPYITTQWADQEKTYTLRDSHLELFPLFEMYDKEHVTKNMLPKIAIPFRNNTKNSVSGKILSTLIDELLLEIKAGKTTYKDFTILKNRDFNTHKQAGLLIVKSKKYPFVVKLFMETPQSFIRPFNKGFEPACFFVIGGGSTRHLIGFTRIKNGQAIKKRLLKNYHWKDRVDVPKKWFWLPQEDRTIKLTGYNIGGYEKISIEFPSIYAIVTEAIDAERTFSFFSTQDRREAMDLSNFLLCRIDPHINNFMVEKETGKIIIIDTEHFPSLVGFKDRPRITTYTSWYLHLVFKYIKDSFFRTKSERIALQTNPKPPFSLP